MLSLEVKELRLRQASCSWILDYIGEKLFESVLAKVTSIYGIDGIRLTLRTSYNVFL